jgi:hypothetical protein
VLERALGHLASQTKNIFLRYSFIPAAGRSAEPSAALKATLPAGSVVYPPERNARGEYLLWLSEAEANRLAAVRRRGESYSDAVIRLAKEG